MSLEINFAKKAFLPLGLAVGAKRIAKFTLRLSDFTIAKDPSVSALPCENPMMEMEGNSVSAQM